MQPIPDTGGGLSGFIAQGLWYVYRYFPFHGTWDWLLLFFLLAATVHVLFLPHLWKAVRADMIHYRDRAPSSTAATPGSACSAR